MVKVYCVGLVYRYYQSMKLLKRHNDIFFFTLENEFMLFLRYPKVLIVFFLRTSGKSLPVSSFGYILNINGIPSVDLSANTNILKSWFVLSKLGQKRNNELVSTRILIRNIGSSVMWFQTFCLYDIYHYYYIRFVF